MHTLETLKDKSPEELNVICAELGGWKKTRDPYREWWIPPNKGASWVLDSPAYATSYDAILGEVKKLGDEQTKRFGSFLFYLMTPPHLRIPEAWTTDQHNLLGDVFHRVTTADLTRALILTLS